jgi:hypothetical protein
MVSCRGKFIQETLRLFTAQAGHQNVVSLVQQSNQNLFDLSGAFVLPEDHLRKSLPKFPVVVNIGTADLLEGKMPQSLHGFLDFQVSVFHIIQKGLQVLYVHAMFPIHWILMDVKVSPIG